MSFQFLRCHLPQFQVVDVSVNPTRHQQLCQVFDGLHKLSLPLEYRIKNRVRVNYFKITSSLVSYCDSVTILKPFIASNIFFFGWGGGRRKAFFCHAGNFLSVIVEAGWPSGLDTAFEVWWSWEQAVLSCQPTAACLRPVGFLHSVIIYNVWERIVRIGPEMSAAGGDWSILEVYKYISTHRFLILSGIIC